MRCEFLAYTSRLFILIAFAFLLQGCQPPQPIASSLPQSESIKYNLTLRMPNETLSKDTQKILNIFNSFLGVMNEGNLSELSKYLDNDFKLHIVYQNGTSKSYMLSEISEIHKHHDLKLIFFSDVEYIPIQFNIVTTGEILLILKTKKSSKYFRSRQTFFVKYNREFSKISGMAIRPLLPEDRKYTSEPEIFLTRISIGSNGYEKNWQDLVASLNPDGAIKYVKRNEVRGVTRDESRHSVLVVFPTPLPPGAEIRIEHQFFLTREQRWLDPYRLNYKIDEPGEYQVVESISRAGGPKKRTITYRVFVNGKMVAERTVPVI